MNLIKHPTDVISTQVIGAAIEVHKALGPGLLESSYHRCLCHELDLRGVPYRSEVPLPLRYKGLKLEKGYIIDLLVAEVLIVEMKSVKRLLPIHSAQLMTYMRLMEITAGLLINFNVVILPHGIRRKLL